MLKSVGPCLEASFHSGIGNWMYISVEVGLVALATNHSLILPDFMHMAFQLPAEIRRHRPGMTRCRVVRDMQCASGDHTVRKLVEVVSGTTFKKMWTFMFRWLLGTPRVHVPYFASTVIHLRTVSDANCHSYVNIRRCHHECVRPHVLECIGKTPALPPPIVVMSDIRSLAARTIAHLKSVGYTDVRDESTILNASDHSVLSSRAAWDAMVLWTTFARAHVRFASGISTFSKSALLAMPRKRNFVVDTRCRKAHASDGALFTCRLATRTDLV